ncbi:FHA domain-containing protein [Acrasis kona]|uniref:FHA domain-containing protein n=1 Tax=Acrasis kona TaxID=1008807 RepID=A0AAW2Z8E8_9EUKA
MFGGVDLEGRLRKKDEEERIKNEKLRRERLSTDSRGVAFSATKSTYDAHLYGSTERVIEDQYEPTSILNKNEFKGFKNLADVKKLNDDEEDESENWRKAVKDRYGAPQKFLNETAEIIGKEAEDPFASTRTSRIADREDSYRARWRKRQLSPERFDPFSKKKLTDAERSTKRTYAEAYLETKLDREKQNLIFELQKKEKERVRKEELEKKYGRPVKKEEEQEIRNEDRRGGRGGGSGRKEVWGNPEQEARDQDKTKGEDIIKELPNFEPSGKLAEQSLKMENTGVVLKWTEPVEARPPPSKPVWRVYISKDGQDVTDQKNPVLLNKVSFRFGRDRNAVDIPTDHPSCSKQHAAIVFRSVLANPNDKRILAYNQVADLTIKPYLIDFASTNGTFLNGARVDDSRYYQIKQFDLVRFGNSTREYMFLNDEASEEQLSNIN